MNKYIHTISKFILKTNGREEGESDNNRQTEKTILKILVEQNK